MRKVVSGRFVNDIRICVGFVFVCSHRDIFCRTTFVIYKMSVVALFKLTMLICIHLTIATDCPNPKSPSNSYVYGSSVKAGSTILYRCKPNHQLIGENINICGRNGEWEKPIPVCLPVCEEIKFRPNRMHYLTSDIQIGDLKIVTKANFLCHDGYILTGEESLKCDNGIWNTKEPQCELVEGITCDEPKIPIDGSKVGDPPYTIGSSVKFSCNNNSGILIGAERIVCDSYGRWSDETPLCSSLNLGCGISSAPSPFIVNGNASGIDEWPWQAVIALSRRQKQIFSPFCGGSLLNEDWVLTAAQCVTSPGRKDVLPISMSRIYLGKYYRDDEKDDKYVQVAEVGEIHVHTDYEPKTHDADIAMIKLKKPIKFTKRVRPVCLPTFQSTSENLVENKFGVVTGWGRADLQFASTLKQTRIPVVSSSVCAEGYKSAGITITDNMFCADVCIGNSGSPMVFQQSSTKKWTIEGILNWGSPYGCGKLKNQYTVFVRIQRFVDWINEFM